MLQDTTAIDAKYKLFVEKVAGSKLVWGLKNKEGWANSYANENEKIDVIPFWSDRAYAKACARDEWKGYSPAEIPLAEFLESWCIEMAEAETLAGINWDANMFGKEIDALELAFNILTQLKEIKSAIKFKNYSGLDEFIDSINESTD
jgi:hypothetical protein